MKCPFYPICVTQTINHKPNHTRITTTDVEGEPDLFHTVVYDYSSLNSYVFRDCIETECGAFQNGRCVRT